MTGYLRHNLRCLLQIPGENEVAAPAVKAVHCDQKYLTISRVESDPASKKTSAILVARHFNEIAEARPLIDREKRIERAPDRIEGRDSGPRRHPLKPDRRTACLSRMIRLPRFGSRIVVAGLDYTLIRVYPRGRQHSPCRQKVAGRKSWNIITNERHWISHRHPRLIPNRNRVSACIGHGRVGDKIDSLGGPANVHPVNSPLIPERPCSASLNRELHRNSMLRDVHRDRRRNNLDRVNDLQS